MVATATSRNIAFALVLVGFLLIGSLLVAASFGREPQVTRELFLGALACLCVGWLLLVGRSMQLLWRTQRLLAAVRTHRTAQLAGECAVTLQLSEPILRLLPSASTPWAFINHVVEAHVTAGRYAEALAIAARWSDAAQARGAQLDPGSWALVEVNLAEAEYCAGHLAAAKHRMDALWQTIEEKSGFFTVHTAPPIVINGTATQRAWIAALEGAPSLSLRLLDGVDVQGLPAEYRSEVHYTRAFALSETGEHQAAQRAAWKGLSIASRASSIRNGFFLLGKLACARGDFHAALSHFEAGANQSYRGQGGEALLTWARALRELGRAEQADQVGHLVLARDPQSAAANRALARDSSRSDRAPSAAHTQIAPR